MTALHVEQEVSGDDRSVIATVLSADLQLSKLMRLENAIMEKMKGLGEPEGEVSSSKESKESPPAAKDGDVGVSDSTESKTPAETPAESFDLPSDPAKLAAKLQEVI